MAASASSRSWPSRSRSAFTVDGCAPHVGIASYALKIAHTRISTASPSTLMPPRIARRCRAPLPSSLVISLGLSSPLRHHRTLPRQNKRRPCSLRRLLSRLRFGLPRGYRRTERTFRTQISLLPLRRLCQRTASTTTLRPHPSRSPYPPLYPRSWRGTRQCRHRRHRLAQRPFPGSQMGPNPEASTQRSLQHLARARIPTLSRREVTGLTGHHRSPRKRRL